MRTERFVFLVSAVITVVVYYLTSAPGLGLVDSGELTTVTKTMGIAHPTGYPLYTMLGHLWQSVVSMNAARSMVLFSVTCAALAIGVLSALAFRVCTRLTELQVGIAATVAVLLSSALAFCHSVWTSLSFSEVYPLTLLIVALLIFVFVDIYLHTGACKPIAFIIAAYLWGLGFGNHFTILWFFPILLWIGARYIRNSEDRLRAFVILSVASACGLSINLFLPIRSSVEPLLDWSDPQTLPNALAIAIPSAGSPR